MVNPDWSAPLCHMSPCGTPDWLWIHLGTTCMPGLPHVSLWPTRRSTWIATSPLVLLDIILSAKLLPRWAVYKSHQTCSFINAFILSARTILISLIYPMSMELSLWWNLLEIHHDQGLLDKSPFGDMPPVLPRHHHWTFHLFVHPCHVISHWIATSLVAKSWWYLVSI